MLTKEHETRITNLYKNYSAEIKPLTYYVERKYFKFPKGLLKEYRDVYDHLARCFADDATEVIIEENLKKAENHFDRIKLDIYKYACDYKKREFVRWKKRCNKYDMQSIDNGDFWKDILDMEDEGEAKYFEGRKVEARDINEACRYLRESFEIYGNIDDLIEKKRELIVRVKVRHLRNSFLNQVVGFVVGIAASIIASWLWNLITKT